MDILSPEGFAHAVFQVLRLRDGSGLTMAPVCSSFVWVFLGSYIRPSTFDGYP